MSLNAKEKKKRSPERPNFDEFLAILEKNRSHCSKKDVVKSLKKEIEKYEKKYNMTTSDFILRYDAGEFEMDDNYPDYELFQWSGAYDSYQRLQKEIEKS